MARSWLWEYGKRLTLWGALVSSLPLLFFPLMFFSVLGVAFSVPLGCSVAIYVCFRKFYCILFKEEVEVQKGLGVKGSEAHEGLSWTEAQQCEGEASLIEKLVLHEEEAAAEGETNKDGGGEAQLKECDTHGEEEEALKGEREEERGEEEQVQLEKKWDTHGEGSPIEKIAVLDLAPEDEAHYIVKDEEKVDEGEAQLKLDAKEEEVNDRLADPQGEENARQDEAAEVETQSIIMKEVEVNVNSSEREPQSDHSCCSNGENIGTNHKTMEEQDENNEKLYATDTNHKIREEEDKEQDESNEMKEIPHKSFRHEQSLDLAPSTLDTEYTSTEANMVIPEAGQHSIQAESPLEASNVGVENEELIKDNVAAGLPILPTSEILVSSASESHEDSKSLSEGAVKEDTEDAEHVWEEIHALRNIIGCKEDPHPLYAEEIKALYVLTGIEPPPSPKYSVDLDKAKEKLKALKLVYGVK